MTLKYDLLEKLIINKIINRNTPNIIYRFFLFPQRFFKAVFILLQKLMKNEEIFRKN